MKKIVFILSVALFPFSIALQSQQIAVKVQAGRFFPALTHLKGEGSNCAYGSYGVDFPDISVEYIKPSGLVFSATIGYQQDKYSFWEIAAVHTFGGPLSFTKTHKSIPVILSAGYTHGIGKSQFRFNAFAGIGFGMVRSNDVTRDYSFDEGLMTVVTGWGQQYQDSQHVRIIVVDESVKKLLPQTRISAALEYQAGQLFVRTFVEVRSWLGRFGEIKYHSENSSSYYQYSQVIDGHFTLRAGYFGAGLGIGWYFKT